MRHEATFALSIVTSEAVATEIVRTLVGTGSLIAAVPLTTGLGRSRRAGRPPRSKRGLSIAGPGTRGGTSETSRIASRDSSLSNDHSSCPGG
ncbi:MAG: hypothetical protein JWP14_1932 [Frankiales bacterium]|nr:hypothetical protein [Frankiales bacterium]